MDDVNLYEIGLDLFESDSAPGDKLASEALADAVVFEDFLNRTCSYCFRKLSFKFPSKMCANCACVKYCSRGCRENGELWHKYECAFLSVISDGSGNFFQHSTFYNSEGLSVSAKFFLQACLRLTLRRLAYVMTGYCSKPVQDLPLLSVFQDNENDGVFMMETGRNDLFHSLIERLGLVLHRLVMFLMDSATPTCPIFARLGYGWLHFTLREQLNYVLKQCVNLCNDELCGSWAFPFAPRITALGQPTTIGLAICTGISKLPRSCDPNTMMIRSARQVELFAVKPIKAGTQRTRLGLCGHYLFNCLAERTSFFECIGIKCSCAPCLGTWPTLPLLQMFPVRISCSSCGCPSNFSAKKVPQLTGQYLINVPRSCKLCGASFAAIAERLAKAAANVKGVEFPDGFALRALGDFLVAAIGFVQLPCAVITSVELQLGSALRRQVLLKSL